MKAPFSWLKDYVDIDVSAQELAEKLFSCGFEVEELSYLGAKIDRVVVGEIKALTPHPDSDHMQICVVDCGEEYGRELQIVTGAPNVYVGMKTPCALDGSTVVESNPAMLEKNPDGVKKIKKGKLRGVESFGMLCSGEELGINDDFYPGAEFNGLLDLEKDAPVGEDIKKIVGLDDWIFDISITANRPDCQCIVGIAREVAAVLKKPFKAPDFSYAEKATSATPITVKVDAPDLCPRYVGHYVENVQGGVSPAWMRKRLALSGIRSISPIVDITNFVLLEMGQPMHAFDADDIGGNEIIVRRATAGEKIVTLDEKEFTLNPENLVICDGNKPVALAGIMGGLNSEIKETTKNVFFESAKFARDSVRKTSRALGQSSDSSSRFEKGVDAYTNALGMARALHLIEELGCGTVTDMRRDECAVSLQPRVMTASISKINALLGIVVPNEEISSILQRLNFKPVIDGDLLTVEIPGYRDDVDGYPDIAEEIIRMYGYDHIIPTFLEKASVTGGGLTIEQKQELHIKQVLCKQGFGEAYNYSFYSPKDFDLMKLPEDAAERNAVRILNPISEELSLMRTTLAASMINAVVRNQKKGNLSGRLFEIAKKLENEDITIAINISPAQLVQNGFVNQMVELAEKHQVDPSKIALEVTETFLVENLRIAREKLMLLKKRGFKIHLDDFGTGYSSLAYLKDLPVDTIKIDREFIKYLNTDKTSRAIVSKFLSLANALELEVIAEGVEDEKQSAFLNKNGCEIIQGWLISKALPFDEAMKLLEQYNGKDKKNKKEGGKE